MQALVKPGDTGPAVRLVQERLREFGCLREDEAGFGPATRAAVQQFQRDRGLKPDALVGPRTRARLFPPCPFSREYLQEVLYQGKRAFNQLDQVVAAVAAGEGGAFDALQLNGDGAGLSFGLLQWAQGPGSLYPLLQGLHRADAAKFVQLFGEGEPEPAGELLEKTRGPGKKLTLWRDPWPLRFWLAGRDLEFQRVQHDLARRQLAARLEEGYRLYPPEFKPEGRIALRALVMLADVGNQAGPLGLKRALKYASSRGVPDEAGFIDALGDYVEQVIRRKYGSPDFGNTAGRHDAICRQYGLEPVDWPALRASLFDPRA